MTAKLVISDHTQLGSIGTNTHAEIDTSIANTIHKNIAAEISTVALKLAPDSNDLLLIEDSADSYNKKAVLRSTMDYKQQVVTVAKAGGQFTTIQAAIDWITTESESERWIVEIAPGEYNENVVLPGWISLKGMGRAQDTVIWANTGNVLHSTAGFDPGPIPQQSQLSNLTLRSTPTAPGAKLVYMNQGGEAYADNVRLEYEPTGTYGTAIDVQLGKVTFDSALRAFYTQTGAGGGNHIFINASNLGGVVGLGGSITMSVAADDDIYGYKSGASVALAADIIGTTLRIYVTHASYSSQCYGIHHIGLTDEIHFTAGQLLLRASGGAVTGDGTGIYINNGSAKISSVGSFVTVEGFANNYQGNIANAGDILESHFDLIDAVDRVIGPGTFNAVTTDQAGNIQVTGSYLNMYDQALTVGARGADHTSIQDAIDAITDAGPTRTYVILIYPGEYAETIVGKDYVGLRGIGNTHDVIVSGATGPLYTFPEFGGDVSWIDFELAPTTTGQEIFEVPAAKADQAEIKDCHFHVSSATNGVAATVVDANGSGVLTFLRCQVDYAMTGSLAGSLGHFIFDMGGSTQYNVIQCQINISIADVNDYLEVFLDSSTSAAPCVISHNYVSVSMTGSNLGGAWFLDLTGGPGDRTLQANFVTMICSGAATANVGEIYYTNSGTAVIHSSSNRFNVTGFTSNYFADLVNAGDTLESQFDDIIAVDEVTGAGTYRYANSPAAQQLDCEYLSAYHIGVGTYAAGLGHLILGQEHYTGSGNKVGIGIFPAYTMTVPNIGNLYGVQGNVFFGGSAWSGTSYINALQFYPAPDYQYGSTSWGNANVNLIGVTTGGMINIFTRTVTCNDLIGIQVNTLAAIFGGPGAVSATRAMAIWVTSPAATTGTIAIQTGIMLEPQLYGVVNQGIWLHGDGAGSDLCLGAGSGNVPDARFYYDGTNLIIDPDNLGAGKVYIGATADDALRLTTLEFGADVSLTRSAANRLDLASGDSFRIISGTLQFAGTAEQISRTSGELLLTATNVRTSAKLEIDGALDHDGSLAGFYGTAPAAKPAALTGALTQITHTGPTTPDYAIATPVDSGVGSAWGFSTQDEFETAMSVILNLQTRVDELESRLQGIGLLT